jgi:uncharacterized protein YcbK (DUF882 family)
VNRRTFLKTALASLAGPVLMGPAGTMAAAAPITLFHTHTGETAVIPDPAGGLPGPADRQRLAHILRDHRTGDVHPIDPALLAQLAAIQGCLPAPQPFHVISGYRSPATNQMLQGQGSGVAPASLHIQGRAVDIRVPGLPSARLHRICIALARGGVGHYPSSNFVHVDTGRVRTW